MALSPVFVPRQHGRAISGQLYAAHPSRLGVVQRVRTAAGDVSVDYAPGIGGVGGARCGFCMLTVAWFCRRGGGVPILDDFLVEEFVEEMTSE